MKGKEAGLSIIIPFVGEYPQVLFTIQSTAQMLLEKKTPFEIIAVNNYCEEAKGQAYNIAAKKAAWIVERIARWNPEDVRIKAKDGFEEIFEIQKSVPPTWEDKSGPAVKACAERNPWLKYIEYTDRLSHWQSKRVGVEMSKYDTLLFLDAHVITSAKIHEMFMTYRFAHNGKDGYYYDKGTMHAPLTYKILEWRKLIYKVVFDAPHFWTYSFTGFRENSEPYEVPCMSTCGMMISRWLYDEIGGWPIGLGIYGGGENFMNYTLAVTGYKKYIYPHATVFHHGEKRDYHYNYDDMVTNRMIAHYLFDGERGLKLFRNNSKGRPNVLDQFVEKVMADHKGHREKIRSIQKMDIHEWAKPWLGGANES